MNIKFRKALSVVLMLSLLGCGTSGGSAASAEGQPAKDAEIKEVEITLDNWQDYFELYNELKTDTASGSEFLEEDQGKEYYIGYPLMIKIKDEYKLAEDKTSFLDFKMSAVWVYHKLKIENGSITVGDPMTNSDYENIEGHYAYTQEDIDTIKEAFESASPDYDLWLDENGVLYQTNINERGPYHTDDLINGAVVYDGGINYRGYNTDDAYIRLISEDPIEVLIYSDIEMKEINGIIYIYE